MLTRLRTHWIVTDILFPFTLTRACLLAIGWFARSLPISPAYPLQRVLESGFQYSAHRLLDMWIRWDSGWYLRLVMFGYQPPDSLSGQTSNMPFFPLYPLAARLLLPGQPGWDHLFQEALLAGVLAANAFLLVGLAALYGLVREWGHPAAARAAVWLALAFPSAFFFSAMYSESTFFACAGLALWAGQRKAWFWAGLAGVLAALSRVQGILILLPLGWLYLESLGWNVRRVRWDIAWLALPALALGGFLLYLYSLTGSLAAPVEAQAAWGRGFAWPWQTLFAPAHYMPVLTPLEQVLMIGALGLVVVGLKRLPSPAYGLYALSLLILPLFTGTMASALRYILVALPLYPALALLVVDRPVIRRMVIAAFWFLQLVLFAAWSQFYWIA